MQYYFFKQCYTRLAETYDQNENINLICEGEDFLFNFLSLLISFYAASLSWNCNQKINIYLRIIYAFFAFIFGIIYIVLYLIFRSGECKELKKKMTSYKGMGRYANID